MGCGRDQLLLMPEAPPKTPPQEPPQEGGGDSGEGQWVPEEAEPLGLLVTAAVVVAAETPWIVIPMRMTMPATWTRTPMRKNLKTHPMGKPEDLKGQD